MFMDVSCLSSTLVGNLLLWRMEFYLHSLDVQSIIFLFFKRLRRLTKLGPLAGSCALLIKDFVMK